MKEVLIITGACAVGKTTTAKAWAKAKDGAIIECDYLTEWIYNKDFPHWTIEEEKFTAKISAKMAIEYLNIGLSIAIENVWTPLGIEIIKQELITLQDVKIKAVRLICQSKENHRRDETRILENQMKERVDIVNEELRVLDWPDYVNLIDNTNISVEDVLRSIDLGIG